MTVSTRMAAPAWLGGQARTARTTLMNAPAAPVPTLAPASIVWPATRACASHLDGLERTARRMRTNVHWAYARMGLFVPTRSLNHRSLSGGLRVPAHEDLRARTVGWMSMSAPQVLVCMVVCAQNRRRIRRSIRMRTCAAAPQDGLGTTAPRTLTTVKQETV